LSLDGATELSELSKLPEPDAIVFDLDGTLVDTVDTRIEGWLDTFREASIPANRDALAALIGSDGKRLAREIAALAGRSLEEADTERLDARAGELYDRRNIDPRPLPGAHDLLTALAASDLPWAIATSSRREQVSRSVEALMLPQAPRIVDGSHVEHAKPAPDLLLLSAERLGKDPAACWYVGDATWDMLSAVAAEMVAIGMETGAVDGRALREAGAAVSLRRLEDLQGELSRRGRLPARPGEGPREPPREARTPANPLG